MSPWLSLTFSCVHKTGWLKTDIRPPKDTRIFYGICPERAAAECFTVQSCGGSWIDLSLSEVIQHNVFGKLCVFLGKKQKERRLDVGESKINLNIAQMLNIHQ